MNILITGAGSGIGEATKDYYLEKGNNVYALDIKEMESKDNLVSFNVDITNIDNLNEVVKYLKENNIELDLIINVAGIHKMASLVESSINDLKKVIDVNLVGTMLIN